MVLGEYNAGKSTLLNALLQLPAEMRLPAGDDPVTGKPLRLRYTDKQPYANLLMRDGTKQALAWRQAASQADQRARQASDLYLKDVREVQLFLNHPLLVVTDILDMPGTGTAEFETHTQLTRDYLDSVEMILWVIGETEPSNEGAKDFRKALRTGAPITVVFNAWGSIHNPRMSIDQADLEDSVLQHFPEIPETHFTLYARKWLETQDILWKKLALPSMFSSGALPLLERLQLLEKQESYTEKKQEFAFLEFEKYLWQQYLAEFHDHRIRVRVQALNTLKRLTDEIKKQLEGDLQEWENKLGLVSQDKQQFKKNSEKLTDLHAKVYNRISALAGPCAEDIATQLQRQLFAFIEDKVKLTNMDIWTNLFDKKGLQATLEQQLRDQYLTESLFIPPAQEFVEQARKALVAEWRRFLADIDLSVEATDFQTPQIFDSSGVLQRITDQALSLVQMTIAQIMASLVFIAMLIFSSIIALIILLIAGPFLASGPSPQEKARDRVRTEIHGQRLSIKKNLQDIILGPQGIFQQQERTFQQSVQGYQKAYTAQEEYLTAGIKVLRNLLLALSLPEN